MIEETMNYETAVTQTLNQHMSVRSFLDKAVPDEMLRSIEAQAQEQFPNTIAARDGMVLKL